MAVNSNIDRVKFQSTLGKLDRMSTGPMKNVKQWCSPQLGEVKHMPRQGSMWGFVKKLPQDFPQVNLRPIGLRFAFGQSFGSFLTWIPAWVCVYLTYLRPASLFIPAIELDLGHLLGWSYLCQTKSGFDVYCGVSCAALRLLWMSSFKVYQLQWCQNSKRSFGSTVVQIQTYYGL